MVEHTGQNFDWKFIFILNQTFQFVNKFFQMSPIYEVL